MIDLESGGVSLIFILATIITIGILGIVLVNWVYS